MLSKPYTFKLRYKIAILVIIVSLPCTGAIGFFSYINAKLHVHDMIEFEYAGSINRVKQLIQSNLTHVMQDIRFLSRAPVLRECIRSKSIALTDFQEKPSLQEWLKQVEIILYEMAYEKPYYTRIFFLDNDGKQLVQVSRHQDTVEAITSPIPKTTLLQPGIIEKLTSRKDEVYIAPAGQGVPNGGQAGNIEPALRFAMPVSVDGNNPSAFLIIDILATDFLNVKKMFAVFQMKDVGDVFVTDQKGTYLHRCNPHSEKSCIHRNAAQNLFTDYPDAAHKILSGSDGAVPFHDRQIFYSSLPVSRDLTLVIGLDAFQKNIEAPVQRFRVFLLFVVLVTLLMTWLFSAWFAMRILKSVNILHKATGNISRGDFHTKIHIKSHDELRDLANGFNAMSLALLKKTERLTGLYELSVYRGKEPAEIADRITSLAASVTGASMAVVEKIDEDSRFIISFCKHGEMSAGDIFPCSGSLCAQIIKEPKTRIYMDASAQFPDDRFLLRHHVKTYAGVPILSNDGNALGIIGILDEKAIEVPEEDVDILYTLSRRIAFEWELDVYIQKIRETSLETIHRLLRAAETRDVDTGMHLQRMSHYAAAIARQMGWDDTAVEAILYATPMHDIGKIAVPDRILLKAGKLDPEEWEIMKQHTVKGAKILEGSQGEFLKLAETIALTHHEKWDGAGYPNGLKGEEIPIAGRITALADVFDALTTRRPYKEPFSLEKSLAIIREGRESHFDPQVVDAFFATLDAMTTIRDKYQDLEGDIEAFF